MRKNIAVMLLGLAGGSGLISAQQNRRVDNNALRNASKNEGEWLTYGRDYHETHYSPLKQIDSTNVKRLGLAWTWETESPTGGRIEATPLVSNGVMYGILAWDVMYAIDARTGKFKWRWDPEIARAHISTLCCGPVNRGVALYNGKVYAGLLDGRVVALDQETGKVLWQARATNDPDTTLTAPVRVVKGKVIVGTSGAEHAVRGHFSAYHAETGKMAWKFYTVPGDPSKPFEHPELAMAAKTWTGEWWKYGGGGTVWDGMAYDPDLDILYVGTGNGGPWNQNYRSPGGGDNLFLSSIVAVKPDTGKMVWYFQETPGEHWDYTAVQNIILADLTIDGKRRKTLLHAPKNGFFYVLDRTNGEFISGEKYAKRVTWAVGLDKKGRPIEAKGARYKDEPVNLSPGPGGAHQWQPMSFHPGLGLVFIPGQESSGIYTPDPNFVYQAGEYNTGLVQARQTRGPDGALQFGKQAPPAGGAPAPAAPKPAPVKPRLPEGAENAPQAMGGFLLAWDPVAQKERWRVPGPGGVLGGGTLATAGNLVLQGATFYNAATGEKLMDFDLGGPYVTPISYMLDGKQYISLMARSYPNNRVFTFVLDGKEQIPARAAAKQ
jgi:quinohemoprotein ethanol dehydrogenase